MLAARHPQDIRDQKGTSVRPLIHTRTFAAQIRRLLKAHGVNLLHNVAHDYKRLERSPEELTHHGNHCLNYYLCELPSINSRETLKNRTEDVVR